MLLEQQAHFHPPTVTDIGLQAIPTHKVTKVIESNRIVQVTLTIPPAPGEITFRLFVNKSPRFISDFMRRKEAQGHYAIPFYIGTPEQAPSYARVKNNRIMQPWHCGQDRARARVMMTQITDAIVSSFRRDGFKVTVLPPN